MAIASTFSELALAEAAKLRRDIVKIAADVREANAEIDEKLKAWKETIGNVGVPVRWQGDRLQVQDPDGTWLTGPALTGPPGSGRQGNPGERGPAGPMGTPGPTGLKGDKGSTYMPTSTMATISNGTSLTGVVDMQDSRAAGVLMPSSWTAAVLTFQVSSDNVTYYPLYDNTGAEMSVPVAASRATNFNPAAFLGWRFLKIRSGTNASPVNQSGSRDIWVIGL